MAKIGSFTSEAFSRRKDPFSPGLINLLHTDRKVSCAASRSNVLLGTSTLTSQSFSPPVSEFRTKSPALLVDDEDLVEFREEDIWAADTGGSWSEVKDPQEIEGLGPNEKQAKQTEAQRWLESRDGFSSRGNSNIDDLTTIRMINNNRRRLGLDRELGLSAAFADPGPGLNGTSLAPVGWTRVLSTRGSSPGCRNSASDSQRIPRSSSPYPYPGPVAFQARKQVQHHQSAPLNVPDWSKILGANTHRDAVGIDEDEEEERLPPHELLARESARSPMYTSSMCEGVGRTLKGRDQSRVRNAVLRQTGFID